MGCAQEVDVLHAGRPGWVRGSKVRPHPFGPQQSFSDAIFCSGLRNAVSYQKERKRLREEEGEAQRQETLAKTRGTWKPSLAAAIGGTRGAHGGAAREKIS